MFNSEKISEICKNKKFTSFWELFDFLKITGYDEIESLIFSSKFFEGKIWDNVLLGKTYVRGENNVEIFRLILTTEKIESYMLPLVTAYLNSEKYEELDRFNCLIKSVEFTLDTQLGQQLFLSCPNLQRDYDHIGNYGVGINQDYYAPIRTNNTDDLDDDVRI